MENHGLPKVTEVTDEFGSLCFVFRQSRPVQECESRVRILNILRVIKVILIGKLDLQIVVSASKHSALICFSCELGKPLSHTTRNLCLFVMMLDLNCFVGREL